MATDTERSLSLLSLPHGTVPNHEVKNDKENDQDIQTHFIASPMTDHRNSKD